jgi:hypothetical protein
MRLPRFRFTLWRMMIVVAFVGVALGWVADQARQGRDLVEFRYVGRIENEPFINPENVLKIEECVLKIEGSGPTNGFRMELEDGRLIEMPEMRGMFGPGFRVLDIQSESDGFVQVHARLAALYCGCRPCVPLVRIPLIPVTVYQNHRKFMGRGRLIASSKASRRATHPAKS